MNYNYTSTTSTTGTSGNIYDYNLNSNQPQQQQQQQSLFSQLPNTGNSTSAATTTTSREYSVFQSPLNSHPTLRSSSAGSAYSTPLMTHLELSSSATASASSSSSYSRQRYLSSKGFDMEDDLEFCPEIIHHTGIKFNPYTSMTFSPISPPSSQADPAVIVSPSAQIANNVKKTPVQDRNNTLSPRIHTPRIKKPLEIINPLTGSKVDSPR